jgi:hypothetical protein
LIRIRIAKWLEPDRRVHGTRAVRWRRWAPLVAALLSPALIAAEETEPPREGLGRLAQQANLTGSPSVLSI